MIRYDLQSDTTTYFDKNGNEIKAYDSIILDGRVRTVYPTDNGLLGLDATNPAFVLSGRAEPCQYGVYPLTEQETNDCVLTEQQDEFIPDAYWTDGATGLTEDFSISAETFERLVKYLGAKANRDGEAFEILHDILAQNKKSPLN